MRLIDADELVRRINEGAISFFVQESCEHIETVKTVLAVCGREVEKVINEQPTAYDVEKVIAELEIAKDVAKLNFMGCAMGVYDKAIDIVKRGGE